MFLLDWIKKQLGYHVCEEWTQWETKKADFSRPAKWNDGIIDVMQETITWTERWQERRCTMCGRLQQRELKR